MWGQGQQAQLTSLKSLETLGLGARDGEAQHCSGSPACFLVVRWHFRSEESPQRTLRDENPPGNKLGEMKRYSFLLPCKASPLSCFVL